MKKWAPGLALVLAIVSAVPVMAWTQLDNNYPNTPTSCTGVDPWFCSEWPTNGGLSVNVDVYLHSSLDADNEVSLKTDLRNAFPQWNGIAARNPHLQETASTANDEVYVWDALGVLPDNVYAETTVYSLIAAPYSIVGAEILFNRSIVWNHNYDFSVISTPDPTVFIYRADARKVASHELGHAEGLGHTGISPAVMRQGATTYWKPQANDKSGIIAIYGAYP